MFFVTSVLALKLNSQFWLTSWWTLTFLSTKYLAKLSLQVPKQFEFASLGQDGEDLLLFERIQLDVFIQLYTNDADL